MSVHGFEEVLAAARLGEPWALAVLFRSYSRPIAGYVRARTSSEVEDLVSDVFTSALTSLDRFEGDEAAFRSWLFTIAARRVVDDHRRRGRQLPTTPYEPADDPRSVCSAESSAQDSLGEEWVRRVLDQLAPDQREVLLLRVLGDLTVDEVARQLGKSPGAVKQLQRRGLLAAAKVLEREGVPL